MLFNVTYFKQGDAIVKAFFYLILILMAVAVSVAFTALNPGTIDVNLYISQFRVPVSVVVVLSAFIGILLGVMASSAAIVLKTHDLRRCRKQLRESQSELRALRKQPLNQP